MYHAEKAQEDFFVVSGECLAIVEERRDATPASTTSSTARAGTRHVFVGGDDGCVLLMIGSRSARTAGSCTHALGR